MQKDRIMFGGEEAVISSYNDSRIVILPVPYEATTTYGKGTKDGPDAILKASENVELYDEEIDVEIYKMGIYTVPALRFAPGDDRSKRRPKKRPAGGNIKFQRSSQESALKQIERKVEALLHDGKFPVILGGEHSITPPAVSAFKKKYRDLTVVQMDAHADLRESYLGSKSNHACAMARVAEICPIVQIGVRSMSVEESKRIHFPGMRTKKEKSRHGRKNWILFAADMQDERWIDRVLEKIDGKIYLTIDLDYFDPSIMPSVGTPEPGGGEWYPTLGFLKKLAKKARVVGFDVVELCPQKGNPASDFLAAKLIFKILGYIHR